MVEGSDFERDAIAPLPLAGGVGGGPATWQVPTPLRLGRKLPSLAAPPASGRGGDL